jgi:ADP-ribosyl-[dinitrogen reductase] hydrolase
MITEHDRAKGAFWGLVVGDTLGAPIEFLPRGTFPEVTDMMSGGYFRLPLGAWTDDTAMALCLTESLLAAPELNSTDLMARFWGWVDRAENTSTGKCIGVGQNTMRVLFHYMRTKEVFAPQTQQKSDGNGALMRLSPVACLHWQNPQEARRIAALQSRVTHYSDISAAACELLVQILCRLIAGEPWKAASKVSPDPAWPEAIQSIANGVWRDKAASEISSSGYVVNTLEAALWAVEGSTSFSEAVLKAVNLGDDADSVGAVAGQLAGARYGMSSIPEKWLSCLARKEHLNSLCSSLIKP